MEIPEVEYLENRKHAMMDDDTTVLIIGLNPNGMRRPRAAGAARSCEAPRRANYASGTDRVGRPASDGGLCDDAAASRDASGTEHRI